MTEKINCMKNKLKLDVFTSSPGTFQVTSTLVSGEKEAILFDAQMSLSEAKKVAGIIRKTRKDLKAVYITHGHPDHYWGARSVLEAFPKAEFLASPETIKLMEKIREKELSQWKPVFKDDIPDEPLIPNSYAERFFEIEGGKIEVVGNVQGDDEGSSYLWIPSLKAIVAGDIVYENVAVWVLETDKTQRKKWIETLKQLEARKPEVVIGGHAEVGAKHSPQAIDFTKRYLFAFDKMVENSKSAEEVIGKMKKEFPELNGLESVLQMSAEAAFAKK